MPPTRTCRGCRGRASRGCCRWLWSPKAFDALLERMLADGGAGRRRGAPGPARFRAPPLCRPGSTWSKASRQPTARPGPRPRTGRRCSTASASRQQRQRTLFAYLFAQGRLVRLNAESFLDAATYEQALALLRAHFAAHDDPDPGRVPRPARQLAQTGAGAAGILGRTQVHSAPGGRAGGVETAGRR